jgi:FAD/FMN-containing dehydrogenase
VVLSRFAAVRPFAVRRCAATDDIAEALSAARAAAQPVAVRSGGHCFAGRSTTTGVVIDVSPMSGVEVDGDRAVIGAGTRLAEVYARLAAHGRTIAAGCGPTVGISGLTLGGGLGILGRRYGLTCDQLLAATMVRADGRAVEADDDLLWMLRGGGAPGVVTSLTFRTVPAPDSTAFRLTFPATSAADVLDAWQACLPDLDDAVAPSLVITAPAASGPGVPDLIVTVFGAAPGGAAVDDLIRRLGVRPVSDDRRHGTHLATKQWLSGGDDTPDPRWAYLHSEYFREPLPGRPLIERLLADRLPSEERELDFSPWGGGYNRIAADATAFPHRDARFLLKQTATVAPADRPGPWLDESYALTHPYGTGGAYPNFPDPALPPDEPYYLTNTPRRARIRAHYDPAGLVAQVTPASQLSGKND